MTPAAATFPFLARNPSLGHFSLAPVMPITLSAQQSIAVEGLVDTGAAVNVLPFDLGLQIGADWNQQTATLQLTGNLASVDARALIVDATIGAFAPVRLAFAWAKTNGVPLILGQMNFFLEFDVCFFRARSVFEVKPKGP